MATPTWRPSGNATATGQIRTGSFTPEEPYVFFTDPDGYEVELWYESPTTQDPRGTG